MATDTHRAKMKTKNDSAHRRVVFILNTTGLPLGKPAMSRKGKGGCCCLTMLTIKAQNEKQVRTR